MEKWRPGGRNVGSAASYGMKVFAEMWMMGASVGEESTECTKSAWAAAKAGVVLPAGEASPASWMSLATDSRPAAVWISGNGTCAYVLVPEVASGP